MERTAKIFVAGPKGMVGSAILRLLRKKGFENILLKSSLELDLRNQDKVEEFFSTSRPEYVFLAAAKVGGIFANQSKPAEFLYDNVMIEMNVINAAQKYGVKKLLFLGSSCIYPKFAPQPIKEESLLSGALEVTNEGYALAKICGLKYCQYLNEHLGKKFISAMPTNLYGPNDNYHPFNSHVLPALLRRIYEAKQKGLGKVVIWGSGNPLREFLYADDLAEACLFLMEEYEDSSTINIGSGREISIKDLAFLIKKVVGYEGELEFDEKMPDGTPRKLLDCSRINAMGWVPHTKLEDGLKKTLTEFITSEYRVER